MPTGGEVLVSALEALDVEVAFGLPGVHNLAAWKGFASSAVRLVGVRHEQTAGYAADGYARATGRLGVAVTTTGPGAANVVAATGEAWSCHTPLLVVATDVPTTARRPGQYRGVLHETTDQASFFRPVTKAVVQVRRAEDLYADVVRAGRLAMTAPRRPVYLEVPTDLLSAVVPGPVVPGPVVPGPVVPGPVVPAPDAATTDVSAPDAATLDAGAPDAATPCADPLVAATPVVSAPDAATPDAGVPDVTALVAALRASTRPLLWAGGGATSSGASAEVVAVAEALGAPVLSSYGGRGLVPPGHPCLVGLPPHTRDAGQLWDDADCVLVLGSDLDAMNTQGFRQPRPPVLLAVDLATLANVSPDVQVNGDVKAVLAAVAPLLDGPRAPWWSTQTTHEDGWSHLSARYADELAFLEALEDALPPDAVVVADMCVAGYWYGGFGRVSAPRGLAYPVGWGTLGFGFPAALGTSLSGRPTVAVVGDGGFLFACGDLATAAQERLPVTVVLVDDGGYGMLRYDFTKDGEPPVGTELEPPDFVALARAFRVDAREVEVGDLTAAVQAGVASGRPNLVVVKAQYAPPPNTSPNWYRVTG